MSEIIIMAAKPSDELIGCYEILKKNSVHIVFTSNNLTKEEKIDSVKIKNEFPYIKNIFLLNSAPPPLLSKDNTFYFPHPIYERYYERRILGMRGEEFFRDGFNVYFYLIDMDAPFICRYKNYEERNKALKRVYPKVYETFSKSDKQYYIGMDKWINI